MNVCDRFRPGALAPEVRRFDKYFAKKNSNTLRPEIYFMSEEEGEDRYSLSSVLHAKLIISRGDH